MGVGENRSIHNSGLAVEFGTGRTEGVQRMKKEREALESRLMTLKETTAATSIAGAAVNTAALKEHTADLMKGFTQAVIDLEGEGLMARSGLLQD